MQSIPPAITAVAFNCPHCHAYAHQPWSSLFVSPRADPPYEGDEWAIGEEPAALLGAGVTMVTVRYLNNAYVTECSACKRIAYWEGWSLIYPRSKDAPPPNPDLPDECRADYEEAAAIMSASPRGAAALLRLAIQKLCVHLGGAGENINTDIKALVAENKVPEAVRQALDAVRIAGNNAVHPGEMNLQDTPDIVARLFAAVNYVVNVTITQPKEMAALYGTLPDGAKAAADRRDGRKPN